jgi:hypothetical protein
VAAQAGTSASASPSAVVSHAADAGTDATMVVAGTEVDGEGLHLTVALPPGWTTNGPYAAHDATFGDPAGAALFLSVVDNTFSDPCGHTPRNPKVDSTAEAIATALRETPGSIASDPVATTLAGFEATYLELTLDPTAACGPGDFYWWQDSPGNYWWSLSPDETLAVWIVEIDGGPVLITARTYHQTSDQVRAELRSALESLKLAATP